MCKHDQGIVDFGAGPSCRGCLKPLPRANQASQTPKQQRKTKVRPPQTVKFV